MGEDMPAKFRSLTKLLVCTDESPESQGMVAAALDLARAAGSKVHLLQVVTFIPGYELQPQDLLPPRIPQMDVELMALREAAVREHLETWKARATEQGVDLEVRVRTSLAAHAGILEEAEEMQPDLIVMGRHGLSGLSRLLMGSVTARVIGHSPFNVVVVPKGAALDFKRILLASDGSPSSAAAWEGALSLSTSSGAALLAVSVARGEKEAHKAVAIVQELKEAAASRGVAVETMVLAGRPYEAILKSAQENQVNLIIMGSHGRTGLSRLLMGSVTEQVIGQTTCAVLVVKKK